LGDPRVSGWRLLFEDECRGKGLRLRVRKFGPCKEVLFNQNLEIFCDARVLAFEQGFINKKRQAYWVPVLFDRYFLVDNKDSIIGQFDWLLKFDFGQLATKFYRLARQIH